MKPYNDFKDRFKLLIGKQRHLVVNTLSNIFTMRLIGNKTHGDLAEIGIVEFINQFMYDFRSSHVGKDLFRAKEREEDIIIINELTNVEFPVSLKAYGDGPLQLSTDSEQKMFPSISIYNENIENSEQIRSILNEQLPELLEEDISKIVLENQDMEMTDEEFLAQFIECLGTDVTNETLCLAMLHYREESISNKDLLQIILDARKITEITKVQKTEIVNAIKAAKLIIKLRKEEVKANKNKIKEINNFIQPIIAAKGKDITLKNEINDIFNSLAFSDFGEINVMPLIYKEKDKQCNIMVFDHAKAKKDTSRIIYIGKNKKFDKQSGEIVNGKDREHPIFMFLDSENNYICEVRYGGASANALQRGLWTHTKNAVNYFESITGGWIDYSYNQTLVKLFSLALNSTEQGHLQANTILQKDIDILKAK